MIEGNPNPKQWLWAAANANELNGDRFTIVQGKRDLYYRNRQDCVATNTGLWNQIGSDGGHATLADCFAILIDFPQVSLPSSIPTGQQAAEALLPAYFTDPKTR